MPPPAHPAAAHTRRPPQTLWIVEFYSQHCPVCAALEPHYAAAARRTLAAHGGRVRFGRIDARAHPAVRARYGVRGFPWVASFHGGARTEDMRGVSGEASLLNFVALKARDHGLPEPGPGRAEL